MSERRPIRHRLKCWPDYFEPIVDGTKTFELRKADRDFRVGDLLDLFEFDPSQGHVLPPMNLPVGRYTGRVCTRQITFILESGEGPWLQPGYVALGLSVPPESSRHEIR
jgi:hypothetical protein